MIIRKAKLEDAKAIAAVHVKSWQEAYKGIISQSYLDKIKMEERLPIWENALKNPQEHSPVYIAETEDGQIVGFASFGIERTKKFGADAELYAIYILEDYKRSKLGTALLKQGLKSLQSTGFKSLLVWVLTENPSINFYQSFKPETAGEESIQIAGKTYDEKALIWHDLTELLKRIEKKEQKNDS